MDADAFVKAGAPLLKDLGFKKSAATWRRVQSESMGVFNVQKSSWGNGIYYINLSTYFRALGTEA